MRKNSLSEVAALERYRSYWRAKKLPFITELFRDFSYADEPLMWLFHAEVAVPEKDKILGANAEGFSFSHPNTALLKCFGEAVERYYSFCPVEEAQYYSVAELHKKKNAWIIPKYSKNLEPEVEEVTLPPDVRIGWYQGRTHKDEAIYIPAQMVSLKYQRQKPEPYLAPSISTGTASHTSVDEAKLNGLYEVIERDAFMCAYLTKAAVRLVNLSSSEKLKKYVELCNQYNFELRVFDITSDTEVPCFLTMLIDRTGYGPALSVGAKAHHDLASAIIGSIAEAFHPRAWLRSLWMEEQTKTSRQLIRPETIHTLSDRGKFWAELRRLTYFDYLPTKATPLKESALVQAKQSIQQYLNTLQEKLHAMGHSVYWVNLTPQELAKDFCIYKAIVPTLQPLYLEERYPAYQKKRLQQMAEMYQHQNILPTHWSWAELPHPFL